MIHGELPTNEERRRFGRLLTQHAPLHEGMNRFLQSFPRASHPMAVLSSSLNSLGAYYSHLATNNHQHDLEHLYQARHLRTALGK